MDTYETELNALWNSYGGTIVEAADVPALVRAGETVYAFGYGSDDALEEGFDALDESDLWAFDPERGDSGVVDSWAPFQLDLTNTEDAPSAR